MIDNTDTVVVGAGLAGLVLTRVLQAGGVPVTVLDQEAGPHVRGQGGLLDIHEDSGQIALEAAGLTGAFAAIVQRGGNARRVLDHGGELRDLLLESLEPGTVRWNAKLTAVHPRDDGAHDLHLADGSTITTRLVVGADGAWSRVRAAVVDAPAFYTGVTSVEACLHDAADRHPEAFDAVGTGGFFVPGHGSAILGHYEATGTIRPRAMIDVDEGWADRVDVTTPEGAEALLEHFAGWAPALRALMSESDVPLVTRRIVTVPTGAWWPSRPGITLIGDAAHVMSPFAGEGANIAMHDGGLLGRALLDPDRTVAEAIAAYEADMVVRAESAVTESARNLEIVMHDPDAPRGLAGVMAADEGDDEEPDGPADPTMLAVGLDPSVLGSRPTPVALSGLDRDAVRAGADAAYEELRALGFTVDRCVVDAGATAEAVYRAALAGRSYDYICIGAGVRLDPTLTHLFEMLVNVGAAENPRATLLFDTGPAAKAEAVRRWFPSPSPLPADPR